jgi:predicted O-methyltransferase YrrM
VYVDRFTRELGALFEDFPSSAHPRDRRFEQVLADVSGLTRANNLALLNLAASLVEPGETYVEIGVYKGASLICAMLGNEDTKFIAVDNFSMSTTSREQLVASLSRYGLAEKATFVEGDGLAILRDGRLAGHSVGVYYYDAKHQYEAQLQALRLIEPYLAERALVIVDDADWHGVQRAIRDYLSSQACARLLLEIGGRERGAPQWWEGVAVLGWQA